MDVSLGGWWASEGLSSGDWNPHAGQSWGVLVWRRKIMYCFQWCGWRKMLTFFQAMQGAVSERVLPLMMCCRLSTGLFLDVVGGSTRKVGFRRKWSAKACRAIKTAFFKLQRLSMFGRFSFWCGKNGMCELGSLVLARTTILEHTSMEDCVGEAGGGTVWSSSVPSRGWRVQFCLLKKVHSSRNYATVWQLTESLREGGHWMLVERHLNMLRSLCMAVDDSGQWAAHPNRDAALAEDPFLVPKLLWMASQRVATVIREVFCIDCRCGANAELSAHLLARAREKRSKRDACATTESKPHNNDISDNFATRAFAWSVSARTNHTQAGCGCSTVAWKLSLVASLLGPFLLFWSLGSTPIVFFRVICLSFFVVDAQQRPLDQ